MTKFDDILEAELASRALWSVDLADREEAFRGLRDVVNQRRLRETTALLVRRIERFIHGR